MDKKKIVVQLDIHDDKGKQKAMNAVSRIPGIESISVDMKDKKLTVIGHVDPANIVCKLRKYGCAVILSVGPDPKEEERKKKEAEEKKKKEEAEKKKKEEAEKKKKEEEECKRLAAAYNKCHIPYCPPDKCHIPYCPPDKCYIPYCPPPPPCYRDCPPPPPPCYRPISCEENPNSCVIM